MDHTTHNSTSPELRPGSLMCVWVPGPDGRLIGKWVPDPQAMEIQVPESELQETLATR